MSHAIDYSLLALLADGCSQCAFDEAEGGIIDHCAKCQRAIVTDLYQFMVREGYRLQAPLSAEVTR